MQAEVQRECGDPSRPGEGAEETGDRSSHYTRLEKLGSGTYGSVYLAQNNATGAKVAIKQMRVDDVEDGIPQTAIREVALLKCVVPLLPHHAGWRCTVPSNPSFLQVSEARKCGRNHHRATAWESVPLDRP